MQLGKTCHIIFVQCITEKTSFSKIYLFGIINSKRCVFTIERLSKLNHIQNKINYTITSNKLLMESKSKSINSYNHCPILLIFELSFFIPI